MTILRRGPKPECDCGDCRPCRNRVAMREYYRKRRKEALARRPVERLEDYPDWDGDPWAESQQGEGTTW